MIRVAINGFGRIGRSVYRILSARDDIDVAYINDIAPSKTLAYLLKYDTVMRRFPGEVRMEDGILNAGKQQTRMVEIPDPRELPWEGIDIVVEATGRLRSKELLSQHLNAGARRVLLTVPAKDEIDATIVLGVNDQTLRREHRIVSNASCTTNCLAPVAKVLHEEFRIERGLMNTVHAYTNDQRLADVPHADLRRSRAATENIIPTTTGAAKAVGKVLPELQGKLDGLAMRVPVPDGSVVDLVLELGREVTSGAINEVVRLAAAGPMNGILEYSTDALVSSDVIGNPHSSIFDAPSTQAAGKTARILSWYDNEWGYSNRVVDLIDRMSDLDRG